MALRARKPTRERSVPAVSTTAGALLITFPGYFFVSWESTHGGRSTRAQQHPTEVCSAGGTRTQPPLPAEPSPRLQPMPLPVVLGWMLINTLNCLQPDEPPVQKDSFGRKKLNVQLCSSQLQDGATKLQRT